MHVLKENIVIIFNKERPSLLTTEKQENFDVKCLFDNPVFLELASLFERIFKDLSSLCYFCHFSMMQQESHNFFAKKKMKTVLARYYQFL